MADNTSGTLMEIVVKLTGMEAKINHIERDLTDIKQTVKEHNETLNKRDGFSQGTIKLISIMGAILGLLGTIYGIITAINAGLINT